MGSIGQKKMSGSEHQPVRLVVLLAILWTVIISGSLTWSLRNERKHIECMAINEARSNFNKDQAFRFWATGHGGVYVKPDEHTPPNPYLSHVPDRDLVSSSGISLTLMNPAYIVRQLNEQYSVMYGIHGDITSLKPLRPENTPDEWQKMVLFAFERGITEESEFAEIENERYLRLMKPMITQQGCLKCHAAQGYKVGDVRGGVSVSVPMAKYERLLVDYNRSVTMAHFLVWFFGLAGLGLVSLRLAGNMREIMAIKASLNVSKRQYENAMLVSNDGMFEIDLRDRTVKYNSRWFTMLGYEPGELPEIYDTWKSLLPTEHADKIEKDVLGLACNQQRWSYEFRLLGKTGDWVWLLVRGYCIENDESGKPVKVVGTHTDITERKLSENMLEAHLRLTMLSETCSVTELLRAFLDEAEALTDSSIGFFHFMEDGNTVSLQIWSSNIQENMCNIDVAGMKYELAHAGIWADCVREGRVVVHNDYVSVPDKKGLSTGHVPVLREMVVPISRNGKVVAFFGLGNKKTYYRDRDIHTVQELADIVWDIIVRKHAEIELKKHKGG